MKKLYFAVIVGMLLAVFTTVGAGSILANSALDLDETASGAGVYVAEPQERLVDLALVEAAAADFSGSRKDVNSARANRGDVLTYTIVLSNSGNSAATVRVTDTMPSAVSGSVLFFPTDISGTIVFPSTGVGFGSLVLPGGENWVWSGVISANTQIELVLRVSLRTDFTETVTFSNHIDLDDGQGQIIPIESPATTYDPFVYLYLPIVMKNYPPLLAPVNCAPTQLVDIQVGQGPRGIAVDEVRNRIYVANYAANSVSVLSGHFGIVMETIAGVSGPNGIAYAANTDTIWVANTDNNQVTPISAATFAVGTPVTVGAAPWGVAYNPQDGKVYVANSGDDSVSVIDALGSVQLPATGVGSRPYNLAVHKDTGFVYVANFGSNTVSVLNGSGTVQLSIPLADSTQPFGIAVDDVLQNYVYVTTVNSHRIVAIDANTGSVVGWNSFERRDTTGAAAPLRALALNMTVNTTGNGHLWTTTSESDGSDHTQVLLIPKGFSNGFFDDPVPDPASPASIGDDLRYAGIAVNTKTNRVYVSLPTHNSVRVLGDTDVKCFPIPFRSNPDIAAIPAR